MERDLAIGRIYRHYTGEYYIVIGIENGLVIYQNMTTKVSWSDPIENFINSKVPNGYANTNQEYCFERADIIHKLNKPALEKAVNDNDVYCPCALKKTNDTKCMCKMFRESMMDGPCHCGLYEKIWVGDQK